MKNSQIFCEGAQPLPRLHEPPHRLWHLDSRVFGARPATPQCFSGVDAHARRPITVHNKPPKDETNIVKQRPPQKTTVKECASFCSQYTAQLSTDL